MAAWACRRTIGHVSTLQGLVHGSPEAEAAFVAKDAHYEEWALYGDAKFQLTDVLDLSIGGRHTVDKRKATLDLKGQAF